MLISLRQAQCSSSSWNFFLDSKLFHVAIFFFLPSILFYFHLFSFTFFFLSISIFYFLLSSCSDACLFARVFRSSCFGVCFFACLVLVLHGFMVDVSYHLSFLLLLDVLTCYVLLHVFVLISEFVLDFALLLLFLFLLVYPICCANALVVVLCLLL